MKLATLKPKPAQCSSQQGIKEYKQLENLIKELKNRDLSEVILVRINKKIEVLNLLFDSNSKNKTALKIKETKNSIIKILEKELKLVPKNYYRNIWMVLGMSTFGIPLGVVLSLTIDNWAFISIGIPIGMAIGMAYGASLDNKAEQENRQLILE